MIDMVTFRRNQSRLPREELEKYNGQFVAWSPDGTRIIAAHSDPAEVDAMIKAAGFDPSETLVCWVAIPEEDITTISIPAQVVNGHLHHQQNLAELEGQRVIATLTVIPKESMNGKAAENAPSEPDEFDPEPPPWLEVENDVYFPMTVPEILLEKKPLIVERGTPSLLPPEEMPVD